MRNAIGTGLVGLGYVSGLVFGLWGMILDAGVLLSIGGLPLLVVGFILFPVAIVGVPLYAGFAWGDWHPFRVTAAGMLMWPIFGIAGMMVRKKEAPNQS